MLRPGGQLSGAGLQRSRWPPTEPAVPAQPGETHAQSAASTQVKVAVVVGLEATCQFLDTLPRWQRGNWVGDVTDAVAATFMVGVASGQSLEHRRVAHPGAGTARADSR